MLLLLFQARLCQVMYVILQFLLFGLDKSQLGPFLQLFLGKICTMLRQVRYFRIQFVVSIQTKNKLFLSSFYLKYSRINYSLSSVLGWKSLVSLVEVKFSILFFLCAFESLQFNFYNVIQEQFKSHFILCIIVDRAGININITSTLYYVVLTNVKYVVYVRRTFFLFQFVESAI